MTAPDQRVIGLRLTHAAEGSSLAVRSYLGTPFIESFFRSVDYIRRNHSAYGKYEDAHKNLIGLERCAGYGDHKAYPRSSGVKLPDHHADQCSADREPQSGENKWDC
jgi:hypothetical protein